MEKMKNTPKGRESVPSSRQSKKRSVISYANLGIELMAAFKEKYPRGYSDYMSDVFKVDKPDGSFFYAVSLETPDAVYLVKVEVKIDDYEDLEKGLFGSDSEDDSGEPGEFPDNDSGAAFGEDDGSDD
jgi:hypothetical protein